jgi:uncharacterized membrane protein YfcA
VPTALVGGLIILKEGHYKTVTGLVLLSTAMVLAFRRVHDDETGRPAPLLGAIIVGAYRRGWWGLCIGKFGADYAAARTHTA